MIRNLQGPEDSAAVLRLWHSGASQLEPGLSMDAWQREQEWLERELLPQSEVWLFGEQEVLGFVLLKGNSLAALCVAPSAQGRGIGKALLAYARVQRRDLQVHLCAGPQATAFFKRQGFRPVRELLDSRTGQPAVLMVPGNANNYFSC
ncbi:GNAT family N-acetyltransferase [Gallaecimonas kandeliae]|uniref:GNAT family N-acetyltransferase n=1 Tax=Gallaecimonas kandeliae TaxID=3029055 RepID=UPI00264729F7|nr:GNAT family N-acetyltransferase [Gallaecimonas kandeliae]WKE65195.1 GNAT family N-acetyltransferase [Gallaecimonas kandeliae]